MNAPAQPPSPEAPSQSPPVPLVVDLDGTLTPADTSLEAFIRFGRQRWFHLWLLLVWIVRGRSLAKAMVTRRMGPGPVPPLRPEVVALIDQARAEGRPVWLASGSHWRTVRHVARALPVFDVTMGTQAIRNLTGQAKLARIRDQLAQQGGSLFDYVGDSRADRPLWQAARSRYTTRYHPPGIPATRLVTPIMSRGRALWKSLRPHQWAKNALVFVPLATAGLLFDGAAWAQAGLAAIFFSLVASGIYQLNDLLDIDADRAHHRKRHRPLAAGMISIPQALLLSAVLVLVPLCLAYPLLGRDYALLLLTYFLLSCAYSFRLKQASTLDVITLGCLYTLRIAAGAAAIGVALSFWLFVFSLFFFLSLGYVKRYTELQPAAPDQWVGGRGYVGADLDVIAMMGIAAGTASILVMALFVHEIEATGLYAHPQLLWGLCVCLLYWINRVWMLARRGQLDGDPVAFALKDRRSLVVVALMGGLFLAARYGG